MSKAVADVYGVKMSGILAWLLWRSFCLSFLPGLIAKFRVGLNWVINAVMPQHRAAHAADHALHPFLEGRQSLEPAC